MTIQLGKKLKVLRLLRGMQQSDLCKLIGVSRPILVAFEQNAALPGKNHRVAIEDAFGLELNSQQTNAAFEHLAGGSNGAQK